MIGEVGAVPAAGPVPWLACGADGAGFISNVLSELEGAGADPVLINTSFNARGEPIVNSAEDAVRSAEAIGVDFLVLGEVLLDRAAKPRVARPRE